MLAALKQRLAELVDPPIPADSAGIPTGIAALDRVLPGGGLPRGRLTEIRGAPGSGVTTLLRILAEQALDQAMWVACIDATRTFSPRDWAPLGTDEGLWMVRPRDPARAAWCADVLLRSGAFPLVVLDGAPPLPRPIAVRLVRLARDAHAAFVVTGDDASCLTLGGSLRLRVERHRAISITIEKGAPHHIVEVRRVVALARRLCAHPEIPDRRGVAARRGAAAARAAAHPDPRPGAPGLAPNRKRRCAEPEIASHAFVTALGER